MFLFCKAKMHALSERPCKIHLPLYRFACMEGSSPPRKKRTGRRTLTIEEGGDKQMFEKIDCVACSIAFSPEETKEGPRILKTFRGYTVDLRLRQFRIISLDKPLEFIEFDSSKGQTLIRAMHEKAIKIANERFR